jgi:hypothetical protein
VLSAQCSVLSACGVGILVGEWESRRLLVGGIAALFARFTEASWKLEMYKYRLHLQRWERLEALGVLGGSMGLDGGTLLSKEGKEAELWMSLASHT